MKVTNKFESLCFFYLDENFTSVAFSSLGEGQNISLATERWKINSRWKTPSADRRIAETVYTIGTFFKHQLEVVKTSDRQASSQRHRNDEGNTD